MNLYQIRQQINAELAKAQPDEALISELIAERDRLSAAETFEKLPASEWHARMLQYTHG